METTPTSLIKSQLFLDKNPYPNIRFPLMGAHNFFKGDGLKRDFKSARFKVELEKVDEAIPNLPKNRFYNQKKK